jgi:SAM-dependent methyltransferase
MRLTEVIRKLPFLRKPAEPRYDYQLRDDHLDFETGVELLKKRVKNKVLIGVINSADHQNVPRLYDELTRIGIETGRLRVDKDAYLEYIEKAGYRTRYRDYYKTVFYEKTLEHFLCYTLLGLKEGDRFVDIASEHSPVPEIFERLTGCRSYSQDIMYKPGIHGNRIGSDAVSIPVPDEFFNAAIATCSIEHFEQDSDVMFMREMARVLATKGRIVLVPLYLYPVHSCQTDPRYSVPGNVVFDEDADIYCMKDWGNRHGRIYSPLSLRKRLIEPSKDRMHFCVHLLDNPLDIDRSVYCRFILVGIKK